MDTWKWWGIGVGYWAVLVWVPPSRRATWWILRAVAVVVVVTLSRTGAGLRAAVVAAWRLWRQRRRRQLWPLKQGDISATRGQVTRALANLADLADWEATPTRWVVDRWQRQYFYTAATMPDRERISRVLCAAGCNAPLARLSIIRDQYGDSNRVIITITDRAQPKPAPTPLHVVAPMSPQVDEATATHDDPYVAALASGPATTQQLAERFGKARPTIHKALTKRANDGLVTKVGALWMLPSAS